MKIYVHKLELQEEARDQKGERKNRNHIPDTCKHPYWYLRHRQQNHKTSLHMKTQKKDVRLRSTCSFVLWTAQFYSCSKFPVTRASNRAGFPKDELLIPTSTGGGLVEAACKRNDS